MSRTIKDDIVQQVDKLGPPEQRRVLEFVRSLTASVGTPGHELLKFAGCIDLPDLDAISKAIQEACENVDPNGW